MLSIRHMLEHVTYIMLSMMSIIYNEHDAHIMLSIIMLSVTYIMLSVMRTLECDVYNAEHDEHSNAEHTSHALMLIVYNAEHDEHDEHDIIYVTCSNAEHTSHALTYVTCTHTHTHILHTSHAVRASEHVTYAHYI